MSWRADRKKLTSLWFTGRAILDTMTRLSTMLAGVAVLARLATVAKAMAELSTVIALDFDFLSLDTFVGARFAAMSDLVAV